jgi:F0F1-type ATP synthase membrane subunit b/b'
VIGVAAKAKLLVFVVFLMGAVTGAVVEKVYDARSVVDADATPAKTAQKRAQEVQDYLDLNDEQRRQFDVIVEVLRPER